MHGDEEEENVRGHAKGGRSLVLPPLPPSYVPIYIRTYIHTQKSTPNTLEPSRRVASQGEARKISLPFFSLTLPFFLLSWRGVCAYTYARHIASARQTARLCKQRHVPSLDIYCAPISQHLLSPFLVNRFHLYIESIIDCSTVFL